MNKIQNPKVGDIVDIITPDKFKVKMKIIEVDQNGQTITLGIPNTETAALTNKTTVFLNNWRNCRVGEKILLQSGNNVNLLCNLSVVLRNGKLILSIDPKSDEKNLIRKILRELQDF